MEDERGVEKIIHYKIEGFVADSVRKVLAKISDTDFKENFGLSYREIEAVHNYLDNVDLESDEVKDE